MDGIILFGDSVLFGTGASSRNNGCGRLLRHLLENPILIKSHNLDTTNDAIDRIDRDILKENNYSRVVVLFGNNDCRLKDINTPLVSIRDYRFNLKRIIHKIKSINKIPFLCNLQPISSDGFFNIFPQMRDFIKMDSTPYAWQKEYSDICTQVANNEKIPLIDIRTPLERNIQSILAADGLHPNDLGHQIIAQQILGSINNYG